MSFNFWRFQWTLFLAELWGHSSAWQQLEQPQRYEWKLHLLLVELSDYLPVRLSDYLTIEKHITSVSKSVHYHIGALRHICSSITQDMATTVATALVGSHLDYMNSVLYGTTQKIISKLQKAKNLLARVVFNTHRSNSHTLLQQLHWFPIKCRYNFKIANITFNTLHYSQPTYLHSLLCFHTPARSLMSSDTNLLTILFAHTALGARSFSVASKIWNSVSQLSTPATVLTLSAGTPRLITSFSLYSLFIRYVPPSLCLRFGICWHCAHL